MKNGMNKMEMGAVGMLVALLIAWTLYQNHEARKQAAVQASRPNVAQVSRPVSDNNNVAQASRPVSTNAESAAVSIADDAPRPDEIRVELENETLRLGLTSYGGVVTSATLLKYPERPGKDSPPVAFAYNEPVLAWSGLPGFKTDSAYALVENTATSAVFSASNPSGTLAVTRRYDLLPDHTVRVRDTFRNTGAEPLALPSQRASLGDITRGDSKNETLTADVFAAGTNKVWHLEKDIATALGATGGFMGCGGNSMALRERAVVRVNKPVEWVALKTRFFAHFVACDAANTGLDVAASAKTGGAAAAQRLSGGVGFAAATLAPGAEITRAATVYIGPKRLDTIKKLGTQSDQIMQFGFFAWFCKLLLPLLNFFYALIPNYGVAIILLTFLVRVVFWPLTHKTAESSRRMAALQPKIKELQAKFKDNPQKLQQATMALYREHKVNPFATCVPMFIQLPVFIALFTVLRSAVELRFAPFLWIADLSEPENLFPGLLPITINPLPVVMAATMALQSHLTPAMGDPAQKKMMLVMMPVMMLFICYTFPSALSLYWTVSQVIAIIQLLHQQRRAARENAAQKPPDDPLDKPSTRQMRRRLGRA